ncbi:MAG: uroporphyrinogen-III C-methyltransferase [Eubacterium sp.]|jgi:uroporphyrinogen III methyltransferase/synthase
MGTVYLVGAGPGDPELVTVKALRLIQRADLIVYDSLAPADLLKEAPPSCQCVHVGKRAGRHSAAQEEINHLLIAGAQKYETVVRLKGGDPFVFGRGGEEVLALQEAGVPYRLVPGVTSSVAVPEAAGIPVTHRRLARSFHVITGHIADDELDYAAYAHLEGTLVFLMGLSALPCIASGLLSGGMAEDTPAAVVSQGFTERQRVLRAPLSEIAERTKEKRMGAPAVVVVGPCADLDFLYHAPFGIIGSDSFYARMERAMDGEAGMLSHVMRIRLSVTEEGRKQLREAFSRIEEFDWVVFTSRNAVAMCERIAREDRYPLHRLDHLRFAAIGPGTAERLRAAAGHVDLLPESYTSDALGQALAEQVGKSGRVLVIRAEGGRQEMFSIMDEAGMEYEKIRLYRSEGELTVSPEELGRTGILAFASASGVDSMFALAEQEGFSLAGKRFVCIGEATADALRKRGIEPEFVTHPHTAEELARRLKLMQR